MSGWNQLLALGLVAGICLLLAQGASGQEVQVLGKISEIRVKGTDFTEDFFVRSSCGLFEGQDLRIGDAARAIRNLYGTKVFSDVQIFSDQAPDGNLLVEIRVVEYPRLREVKFEGNKALSDKKLNKETGLIKGQLIKPQQERRMLNKLRELYKEEGYLLAELEIMDRGERDTEGYVPLTFQIKEGQKVNLKKIRFHGNETFPNSILRKQMKETKQDGWWLGGGKYKEETFPEDKQKVVEFYSQNGYRDAEIVSDSLSYGTNQKDMYLDITVEEGPHYRFGKVSWEGNEKILDQGVAYLIVADSGDVYSSERLFKSGDQLRNAYMDGGYITAEIYPQETSRDDHVVDVHFIITENEPWTIKNVFITGNNKTKDRVIRREIAPWLHPGQTFSRSGIERSVREVQQLNFFSNVEPDIKPRPDTSQVDVIFKVEEKSTGTASVGAGYSERDKLVGTIALQIPNFRGNGQQLDFQWEFGTRRETFRIGFTEPWFRNTPTSLSGSLFRDTQRFSAFTANNFDQRAQGGAVRIGRRLRWVDYSRVSVGFRLEEVKFINFADSSQIENRQASLTDNVTSSVSATFNRDSRDLPLFATSGSVFTYTPALAGGFLGGNRDFHKHDIAGSFYFPLFWRFALNLRTQIGLVAGYGSAPIPFNELYTPGGVSIFDGTMLRGYDDQSVGPHNTGGQFGGVAQMMFNAEISLPIVPQQFYGLLFADAGNAWADLSEISMFDLRRSVGFGIRIVAPVVGIMGFDFAWGIDRNRVDGGRTQMMTHFQFGPQFF